MIRGTYIARVRAYLRAMLPKECHLISVGVIQDAFEDYIPPKRAARAIALDMNRKPRIVVEQMLREGGAS